MTGGSVLFFLHKNIYYKRLLMLKKITGCDKLNLICHSMGGLLGRSYVQSDEYKNDVNQLIILCTPNAGSPPNYSYWTGGSLLSMPLLK